MTPDDVIATAAERQVAQAMLVAFKTAARRGWLPVYVPEALRGYLLRLKTRHSFSTGERVA